MKAEFIITRQGKDFVLYEGLLDEAHQQGLKSIKTTLIQIPSQDNGNTAIMSATVETEKGVFMGIGDASPQNVNRMIVPHLLRMSETRAKARALRDAINIGITAVDELGGESESSPDSPAWNPETEKQAVKQAQTAEPGPGPAAHAQAGRPVSENQKATITKLGKILDKNIDDLLSQVTTFEEAGALVTSLSREFNEKRST